jgi:hypothetical protein
MTTATIDQETEPADRVVDRRGEWGHIGYTFGGGGMDLLARRFGMGASPVRKVDPPRVSALTRSG